MRGAKFMQKSTTINVTVHYPEDDEGKRALSQRVAAVHVEAAKTYIEGLPCPAAQKLALADAAAHLR